MESVILSQQTLSNVLQLNFAEVETIAQLCKYFLQSLIMGSSSLKLDDDLDESLSAISTVLLEASRVNADSDMLRSFLKEQGVSDNANGVISEFYGKHGSIISSHMSVTGISAAQIVGIDWRLDYSVRSKHAGQDNTPLFLLSLKIKEANSEAIKPVEIIATQEELQDMLSKVRDAVKQVERVVVGNANTA